MTIAAHRPTLPHGWQGRPVRSRRRSARGGFTLIELVVSITIGVIISGIAGMLIWNASRQRAEIAARCDLIEMGSATLEVMLRHLREIPQDGGLAGDAQIDIATATEIRFDGNNIGFRLDAGTVETTLDGGSNWYPLAVDVSGLTIAYFQGDGTELNSFPLSQADRENVRRIQVDLQMSRSSQNTRLRCAVYLRSFMNEA